MCLILLLKILNDQDNDKNETAQSEPTATTEVTIKTEDNPKEELKNDETTDTKESTTDVNEEKESPKIEEGVVLRKKVSE